MKGSTQPAVIACVAIALSLAPMFQDETKAATDSSQFCPDIQFSAYSTDQRRGQRAIESMVWDGQQHAYVIRGPQLARLLNFPGVAQIPKSTPDTQVFKIAIDKSLSKPADRLCEQKFQEFAVCTITGAQEALANYTDVHREVVYTQIYTDCDLQTYNHVIRISADNTGKLMLLELSFQDLTGQLKTLVFGAHSDLRLGGSQAIIPRQ